MSKRYVPGSLPADYRNCPIEGVEGSWIGRTGKAGKRGESNWCPNEGDTPVKYNPDGKTWETILTEYGIKCIKYISGEPNFRKTEKDEIIIADFSSDRSRNFDKADVNITSKWNAEAKGARENGWTPEDVEKWRTENQYTWHECRDCATMQLVPSEVHNNFPHRGGISIAKEKDTIGDV